MCGFAPTSCVLVKVPACVRMYVGVFAIVFLSHVLSQPFAPPSPDKRAHVHTCLSSAHLQKAVPARCTWDALAFGFAQHLGLFSFFVCRLLLSTCPPLFALLLPLTLHQAHWPTNQVSSNKHFYTCPSGKRSLLQCHTGITWQCDSLWMHCSEDEPRALFRNKFSIVVPQQKASILLTELGRCFVNWILQSCYIHHVITMNVVFHRCRGTTTFTRTSFV